MNIYKSIKEKLLTNLKTGTFAYIAITVTLLITISITNVHTININHSLPNIEITKVSSQYKNYRIEMLVSTKFSQMSLDEKIGQLFMLSITNTYITNNTNSLVTEHKVGSIVIMSENIASQTQLTQLISDLQNLADTPLLIAADQEGGIVARIPWDEARSISQPHIGIVNREDFAYSAGEDHAQALKNVSINMNLAPVLDVSFISNSMMANRTFGASCEQVSTLGTQIIIAHQDNDIIPTAKHFPGIGRSAIDSHLALPEINISKDQLLNEELIPFKSAIEQDVEVIMTGHVIYPQIDNQYPATLSKIFITDILRNELNFEGVIITDDIRMEALVDYPNKAVDAVNAGCDMILIVDSSENQIEYIEQVKKAIESGEINEKQVIESMKRILRLKYKYE